jgi:two-component system response regulator QseB
MPGVRYRARHYRTDQPSELETSPAPRRAFERRSAGSQRTIRVLLVEDDEDIRLLLTLALRAEDYDVTPVPSADEALKALRDRRHDLILTDYCLPGKDGMEMIHEARRSGVLSNTPVIVCTALPLARQSSVTVLQKPIELDALIAQIRKIFRR